MDLLTCTKCKEEKNIESFCKDKSTASGYSRSCKQCRKKWYDEWSSTEEAKEKNRQRSRRAYKNPEYRERQRDSIIKRKYNIDYNTLLLSQGGVCAICNKEEDDPRHKYLSVDHCHETGEVRGLLCNNCNKALGQFMDNIKYLENAINYLKINDI